MKFAEISSGFEGVDRHHGDPWTAFDEINEALEGTSYRIMKIPGESDGYRLVHADGGED